MMWGCALWPANSLKVVQSKGGRSAGLLKAWCRNNLCYREQEGLQEAAGHPSWGRTPFFKAFQVVISPHMGKPRQNMQGRERCDPCMIRVRWSENAPSALLTERPARSVSEPECQWQSFCHTCLRVQLLRMEGNIEIYLEGQVCNYNTFVHFSSGEDSSPAGNAHPQGYTWESVNSCAVTRLWTSPTGTLTKCEYKSGTPDLYWPYLPIKQQRRDLQH